MTTRSLWRVGEFIRLYVTRNARWLSPKFLKSAVVP
jgi:hypothetical protein